MHAPSSGSESRRDRLGRRRRPLEATPVRSPRPRHPGRGTLELGAMARIEIVDVTDEMAFGRVPPCADPSFDHRTCDYWEDADRGSKAGRPGWLPAPSGWGP